MDQCVPCAAGARVRVSVRERDEISFHCTPTHVLRFRGRTYLFSIPNGALFRADELTTDILDAFAGRRCLSVAEVVARLRGRWPRDEIEAGLQELHRTRILDSVRPAEPAARSVSPSSSPLTTLVCILTRRCNLACGYCYSRRTAPVEEPASMSETCARQAVDFLIAGSADERDLNLVLFGGEPLLAVSRIQSMVAYAKARAAESGKRITFSLTTNGTRLTPDVVAFLEANRVSLTVSVDGPRHVHDSVRMFNDGSGSYARVAGNVQRLFALAPGIRVAARVTVTRRAVELKKILVHLRQLGFSEVGFSPASTSDPEYSLTPDDLRVFTEQFQELAELYCESAAKGEYLGFSNLSTLLRSLQEGCAKTYPCGAGIGLVAVDADGRLYLCHRLAGHASACVGHVDSGLKQELRTSFLNEARLERKAECTDCWARHLCGGGCYHESLLDTGLLTSPARRYCTFVRRWFEIGIEAYLRILEDHPAFLRVLGSRHFM